MKRTPSRHASTQVISSRSRVPLRRDAVATANSVFTSISSKAAALAALPTPYKVIDGCSATPAELTAISATDRSAR